MEVQTHQNFSNHIERCVRDLPGFQISVSQCDKKFFMKAINNATGTQYGPQLIFPGISSSVVLEYLEKEMSISEVTDHNIKVQTRLLDDPIELIVQETTPLEKEHHLFKVKIQELENQVKNWKDKTIAQEGELNQLRPLQAEVQTLKSQVGKIFYLKTSVDDWKVYNTYGIMVKVDFSHLNLRKNPHVQVSLNGSSSHWDTAGSNSVYALTPQSFQIYVKLTVGGELSPEFAKKCGWYLSYVVHSLDD